MWSCRAGMQYQSLDFSVFELPEGVLALGWSWGSFIPPGTAPLSISDH